MKKFTITLAAASCLALAACAEAPDENGSDMTAEDTAAMAEDPAMSEGTIVEVAQGNADFSTLVSALTSAELAETLAGSGPYTVFAPTNAAFNKVPQGTRDELMSEAGQEDLSNILTYHVVQGETNAAALMSAIEGAGDAGYTLTTVNGGTLTAMVENGNVVLTDAKGNKATVTQTDIAASNGVVHVIDTVLMPQ